MIKLAINGARGRMGARLCALALTDDRFELVARMTRDDPDPPPGVSIDAIIDVSSETGARRAVARALDSQSAVLLATTGVSDECLDAARRAGERIAVMIAPNTSLGIAVTKHIAAEAARMLGGAFDLSLVEYHHTAKKDAPSGTAHAIRDEIERRSGLKILSKNFLGIRVADVIGEHSVRFSGPSETIEITHRASSRDLFVRGALEACAWLAAQGPGVYTIEDALGESA